MGREHHIEQPWREEVVYQPRDLLRLLDAERGRLLELYSLLSLQQTEQLSPQIRALAHSERALAQ